MKLISILLATAALLGAAIVAAGCALNVTALFSIGCAAGVVGLFAHDYRRVRRRFQPRTHRGPSLRPALRKTLGAQPTAKRSTSDQLAPTLGRQPVRCS